MDDLPAEGGDSRAPAPRWSRRRFLELVGGGAIGLGAVRVLYELTGFGVVSGTNVTEQSIASYARRRLDPSAFEVALGGYLVGFDGETVALRTHGGDPATTIPVVDVDPEAVAARAEPYGLGGPVGDLAADLEALAAGDVTFEVSSYESFFDRVDGADARPLTIAALRGRGFRRPDLGALRGFTGVEPQQTRDLVTGLADGFAQHTHFDTERYVAGNVQDHLLRGAVDLRGRLREPTTFEAIHEGSTGLYCWEYALRSVEAFHAVDPHRQSTPVFGVIVGDDRHNHAYSGLASVIREDGEVRIPMTFLDYSHSTLYDTYHLDVLLGPGVDAYNGGHRVTSIHYQNIYG